MAKKKSQKFKTIKPQISLFEMQEEILKFWQDNKIFEKSIEGRPENNHYSFYDGPPFITGIPHYATLLPSIAKDIIPRYQTMKGKRVRRVWGWDCHGLPAETKVEKQLGIRNKREIEEMGIDKFVAACREYVSTVSSEWGWYIDHIGRWADMEHAYRTMDLNYMESVIWAFKELYNKGFIYQGMRSSLYCTRCATPLSKFEITMDDGFYREVEDLSVTIKFKLEDEDAYLLAWTTTPWTLPSNRGLAVDEAATYVRAETTSGEVVILAEAAFERYQDLLGNKLGSLQGKDLVGRKYEPLYSYGPTTENDFHVYAAPFVALDDGTGVVHVAPAYGEDDFALGQKNNLSVFLSIDDEGKFTKEVSPYQGKYYKKANEPILDELRARNLLFAQGKIKHQYPHCYRCETPLIYKAQDAWYFRIESLREQLLKTNEKISWVPEAFKHGRFEYNLKNAPDWSLSRSRYWGTPIPIWKCEECKKVTVIGSVAELEKLSGVQVKELHRPDIDEVSWSCDCGGKVHRVSEVFDVWFESGSMPFAQFHYPFENQEEFEKSFPADFLVEYTGQLRGWFYYLHVLGNALRNSSAFKNVVVTGVMKGTDGRKMSKSYGNYPDPKETIKKYGGEALRLYFMSNPIMAGEDMNVNEKDLIEHYRKTMLILWNSYSYFLTYAEKHEFRPQGTVSENILDKWIVGQMERLVAAIDEGLFRYDYVGAARAVRPFVDDLSTWYIRRSRSRFVEGEQAALETLYSVLMRFTKAAAPLLPFTTEAMYQNLGRGADKAIESIHLTDWEAADSKIIQATEGLSIQMVQARQVVSQGLALRAKAGVKVRQPLAEMIVPGEALSEEITEIVQDEVHVKKVSFSPALPEEGGEYAVSGEDAGENRVALAIVLTPELKLEGMARDVIRQGQLLRKKAGYKLNDKVCLVLVSESVQVERMLKTHQEEIMRDLQSLSVEHDLKNHEDAGQDLTIEGERVHLGVRKIQG